MAEEGAPLLAVNHDVEETEGAVVPRFSWTIVLVASIVVFPFVFTFKPSEWFLVLFLTKEFGLTLRVIDETVLPIWTYSFFGFTFVFAFLWHFLGKWCLVAGMIGGVVGAFLISVLPALAPEWGYPIGYVLGSEVAVGLYSAGEVVYSSLLYRLVPFCGHFQHMASISRAMRLAGQLSSSLAGQLMLYEGVALRVLFYVSCGSLVVAMVFSVLLPFDFRKNSLGCAGSSVTLGCEGIGRTVRESWSLLHLLPVQCLCVFLLVTNAVHPLVLTFWQSLFQDIDPKMAMYNAYLFSGCNFLAFGAALVPIYAFKSNRLVIAQRLIMIFPFVFCVILVLMSDVGSYAGSTVWPSYACLLLYHAFFEMSLVVANSTLAMHMRNSQKEHYGVLFCLVYSLAVAFQALVQLVLQQSSMSLRMYFVFLGCVYLLVPVVLGLLHAVHFVVERKRVSKNV